jgi:hypothetical protein
VAKPIAKPIAKSTPRVIAAKHREPEGTGALVLHIEPWASVLGATPDKLLDGQGQHLVAAGKHHLVFEGPDRKARYTVEVPANGRVCVHAKLDVDPPVVGPCAP